MTTYYKYTFEHKETKKKVIFISKVKNKTDLLYNLKNELTKATSLNIEDLKNDKYTIISQEAIIAKDAIELHLLTTDDKRFSDDDKWGFKNIIKLIDEDDNINAVTKKQNKNVILMVFKAFPEYKTLKEICINKDEVLKKLEELYPLVSTRLTLIILINKYNKALGGYAKNIKLWSDEIVKFNDKAYEVQSKKRNIKLTDTRDTLRSKVKDDMGIMKKLILLTHIEYPKRDDYKNILIIRKDDKIEEDEIKKSHDGYFVKDEYKMVLLVYKCSEKFNRDEFIITDERLKKVIDESFQDNVLKNRLLYIESTLKKAYLSLGDIVKRELGVTLNEIRKILTDELGHREASKSLKHNIGVSRHYYKREDVDGDITISTKEYDELLEIKRKFEILTNTFTNL